MKKVFSLVLLMLLTLFLVGCNETTTAFSFDNASFDISLNGDNSVVAMTSKNGGEYRLTIKGSGDIKSFDAEKVPWYVIKSKISSVEIENNVTVLSKGLLKDISLTYLILPESVIKIEEGSLPDNIPVYAYSSTIQNNSENPVYLYSMNEPEASGKYWHYVNENPVVWETYKILFIGNSFTHYDASGNNVPYYFKNIATSLGIAVIVDEVTHGAWTLQRFGDPTDEEGSKVEALLTSNDDYDYIILQEHSTRPVSAYSSFEDGAKSLSDRIKATQKHAKIILYETWGFTNAANSKNISIPEYEALLKDAYEKCAKVIGASVDYVGKAFTDIYNNHKDINLYHTDDKHPNKLGSYLSACTHVATIFKVDVRGATFYGDLDHDVCDILKNTAYSIAFNK